MKNSNERSSKEGNLQDTPYKGTVQLIFTRSRIVTLKGQLRTPNQINLGVKQVLVEILPKTSFEDDGFISKSCTDPMAIKLMVANYRIYRALVDTESCMDVMFYDRLLRLSLRATDVIPVPHLMQHTLQLRQNYPGRGSNSDISYHRTYRAYDIS